MRWSRSSRTVMTADAGLPAGSCAVLIGVSAYEHAEFPAIRAARNSLQAMRSLLADTGTAGNLTTDAHLAALAIEHGLEVCSNDSDFARFSEVRWTNPVAPA